MQVKRVGEQQWAQSSNKKHAGPQARKNKLHAVRIEIGKCMRAEQGNEFALAVTGSYIRSQEY
jgi:hypothetical protein